MELVSLVGLSGVLYPFSAFSSERMYEPKHGVSKVRMVALIWSESGLGLCGSMQVLLEISLGTYALVGRMLWRELAHWKEFSIWSVATYISIGGASIARRGMHLSLGNSAIELKIEVNARGRDFSVGDPANDRCTR